jgi:hypothetical protein
MHIVLGDPSPMNEMIAELGLWHRCALGGNLEREPPQQGGRRSGVVRS